MQLDPELLRKTGAFGLVFGELAAYVGGGFLLGRYVESVFGFRPIPSAILVVVGLVIAFKRIAVWYGKEIKREKERH